MMYETFFETLPTIFEDFFLKWFAPPRLKSHLMASEIVAVGQASLDVEVKGWGFVRLIKPGEAPCRLWFLGQRKINYFVSVGTQPVLELVNIFGRRRYVADARTDRQELWIPYETLYQVASQSFEHTKIKSLSYTTNVPQLNLHSMGSVKKVEGRLNEAWRASVLEKTQPVWRISPSLYCRTDSTKPIVLSTSTEELK